LSLQFLEDAAECKSHGILIFRNENLQIG